MNWTPKARRAMKQEREMMRYRVAIYEGRPTDHTGNPMTRSDGAAHLRSTRRYILANRELYQ